MSNSIPRRDFIKTAGGVAAAGAIAAVGGGKVGAAHATDDPTPPGGPGIDFIPFIPVFTLLFPTYEYVNFTEFVADGSSLMRVDHSLVTGSGAYASGGSSINLIATLPVPNDANVVSVNVQGKTTTTGTFTAGAFLKDLRDNTYVTGAAMFTGTKSNPTGTFTLTKAPTAPEKIVVKNYHKLELYVAGATATTLLSGAQVGFYPDKQGYTALSPTRVYDSRLPNPAPGALSTGQTRTVSVKDARDLVTGAVTTANLVPEGAYCITYNLTVANTVDAGYLGIYPKAGSLKASAINWFGNGQVLANGGVVTLGGDREVTVEAGGPGSTDFVIDITGYYI